jgi:predicted DNA-binding transcriptional regulator AlpA
MKRDPHDRLVTIAEVCKMVGVARPTFYRMESAPGFPSRVQIADGTVRFWLSDILNWLDSKMRTGPRRNATG